MEDEGDPMRCGGGVLVRCEGVYAGDDGSLKWKVGEDLWGEEVFVDLWFLVWLRKVW